MRNPNRILIIHKKLFEKDVLEHFLNSSNNILISELHKYHNYIVQCWINNPDLRFGQLLCNIGLITDKEIEDHIWNIEETLWLVDNNYCSFEDVHFWGINYFKNGKKRKSTKYKLLRDLDLDHIKNIIKFFEDNNAIERIPKRYLNYFNKRINE